MSTTTANMMIERVFIWNRLSHECAKTGGSPGNRTPNLRIKSPLLCLVELATRYLKYRRPAIINPKLAQRVVITKPARLINSRAFRVNPPPTFPDKNPPREHEDAHSGFPRSLRLSGLFGCGLSFRNQAAGTETQDHQQDYAHNHMTHVGRAFHQVPTQRAVLRETRSE